jgi:phage regulator Rha-like protein
MNILAETAIVVEQKGDKLVVDSRLVAMDLGIEHESFMRTIKKYEAKIEQRFGVIRFENGVPDSPTGNPPKFAWLDENQALFLMTLSRNTEQVVECKANLVEAFSKAKKVIPVLEKDNETLRLLLELERERNKGKSLDNTMLQLHGDRVVLALRGQSDLIIEKETIVTEVVEPATGKTDKILTADQLKKAVKQRTGQSVKSLKDFADCLRKAGRDDLLMPVTRSQTSEYPIPEKLDEAIAIVYGNIRQKLIGE